MPTNSKLNLIKMDIPYHVDPTTIFKTLCADKPGSLLLESAEIESKNDLKSLMIIDSAMRIVLDNEVMTLQSQSINGEVVLQFVKDNLPPDISIISEDTHILRLKFPKLPADIDEDSRIKSTSFFDIFRLIQQFDTLDSNEPNAIFLGGLFAYDLIYQAEKLPPVDSDTACPDLCFYLAETMMFIDHKKQTAQLQVSLFCDSPKERERLLDRLKIIYSRLATPNSAVTTLVHKELTNMPKSIDEVEVNFDDETYCKQVELMKEHILAGDIFQVVPSRRFSLPCPAPLSAYQTLKRQNPSPYMFFMQDELFTLFGASPESALKYDHSSRQIEIYPIAGTRPRGKNSDGSINLDLDSRLEYEVRNDTKELAEHIMLVDLARNDLSKVCEPGSRYVADLTKVDRYSVVMHLVSRVVGRLRKDLDVLHAYLACMNMGTLTGAPKVKAMSLIAQTERLKRGSYGGAIGYFNHKGDFDTCIVIRSAYVESGKAYIQAGAGVVLNSVPQLEADESRAKASAVIKAVINAHTHKEDHNG